VTPTVTVCRDCCCRTKRKHPGVDHDAQVEALRDGCSGFGRVIVSQCLLACERSNVVVVAPGPQQRRASGAKPVWLDEILTEELSDAVVDWVRAGGPGVAELPDVLKRHVGCARSSGTVTPDGGDELCVGRTIRLCHSL
jgi:hypothetical protein